MKNFEKRLLNRGYPTSVVEKHLSEVQFSDRKASLKQKNRDTGMHVCSAIPPGFTQLRVVTNEDMAPHTESTTTKTNLCRAFAHIISKRKIPESHSG